jgi:hypothetical protein
MPSVFDPKTSIYSVMGRVGFQLRELRIPVFLFFREQPIQNFAEMHRKFLSLCIISPFLIRGLTCRHPRNFNTPLFYDNFADSLHVLLRDQWRNDMNAYNFQSNFPKLESRKSIEILRFSHDIFTGRSFDDYFTFRCCLSGDGSKNNAKVLFRIMY